MRYTPIRTMPVTPDDLARTLIRRASAQQEADDRARAACLDAVRSEIPRAQRELGFARAWLIGSLAWGGFGVRSDLDIAVEGAGADALLAIADRLSAATGREADVLGLETLPETFRARVLGEGIRVA
jgi:predicted nucleotidyltransferase